MTADLLPSVDKFANRDPTGERRSVSSSADSRSVRRRLSVSIAALLVFVMLAVFAATLVLCRGHFIYSLDDPYISLSLGWHIAHGQYGINASEAASPSSSILYPLILALFGRTAWQEFVPLALNSAAAIATALAFAAALRRYGIVAEGRVARGAVLVVTLCLAINTVGLVFTGLEHSLHALTSVLVVFGLARTFEEDRPPPWLVAAIVLAPLWRFEGMALALLAIAGLLAVRQWRPATLALAALAAALALYGGTMHALGLPLLPSSVLTKSAVTDQAVEGSLGPLGWVAFTLRSAYDRLSLQALPVLLLLLLLVVAAHPLSRLLTQAADDRHGRRPYRESLFAAVVAGALAAHAVFGAWGWFGRYEAYALAFGAAGALVLWRHLLARLVSGSAGSGRMSLAIAVVALLYIGIGYVTTTIETPLAARETYELQYQMHRLAADFWHGPVGVNDIGWVTYRNPYYVLDLLGLGSEAAREARTRGSTGDGAGWMDRLVAAKKIGLVMIYDSWFAKQIPPRWHRLALLETKDHLIFAFNRVSIYATTPEAVAPARAALRDFAAKIDPGTRLTLLGDESPAAADTPPAAR